MAMVECLSVLPYALLFSCNAHPSYSLAQYYPRDVLMVYYLTGAYIMCQGAFWDACARSLE